MAKSNYEKFGEAYGVDVQDGVLLSYKSKPVAADADRLVVASATKSNAITTITTFLKQPDVARQISATAGGTAGDIKAVRVKVYGYDIKNNEIVEELPAFTADTVGKVVSTKMFAIVTKVEIPAMDGNGATVDIGVDEKLAFPYVGEDAKMVVLASWTDGSKEATDATISVHATDIAQSYIDPFTNANDKQFDALIAKL